MEERDEFKVWLKKNRSIFGDRTPDEVASLARYCGWSAEVVYSTLSHFGDALRGSNFDNRARFYMGQEIQAVDDHAGKISLQKQWHDLYFYLRNGTEFPESKT